MVTVQVRWKGSNQPVKGSRVALGFDGLDRGVTSPQYTDSNGEARFSGSGTGEVYVDGTTRYTGRLDGRIVVYIPGP
ncbi:MAG TPA: hypothetical protein ENJ31_08270 [Anaerolineae bacterium]|nr:hypothetical protein [Anaerolineae bacterium]